MRGRGTKHIVIDRTAVAANAFCKPLSSQSMSNSPHGPSLCQTFFDLNFSLLAQPLLHSEMVSVDTVSVDVNSVDVNSVDVTAVDSFAAIGDALAPYG